MELWGHSRSHSRRENCLGQDILESFSQCVGRRAEKQPWMKLLHRPMSSHFLKEKETIENNKNHCFGARMETQQASGKGQGHENSTPDKRQG
jgi:hypothetical protein